MWTLLGIAVVVLGFAFRFNPLLVIAASVVTTGAAAALSGVPGHFAPLDILAALGKAFNDNRYVSIVFVALPAIGLMERAGLQQRARALIAGLRGATTSRLLFVYFLYRQLTAAVGLASVGGPAQTVRPLIAPMAEGAAEARTGTLCDNERYKLRAFTAATDNVAVFFAEDIFLAMSPVLLIRSALEQAGIVAQPLSISLWAIPTAILALAVHGTRIALLGRRLARQTQDKPSDKAPGA